MNNNDINGIVKFINKAIDTKINNINTTHIGTITKINDNKTCDVIIDTQDNLELLEVPFVILSGGETYLQFPIKSGDKCLLIFNKDNISYWFGGDYVSSSDFGINNAFAIVGIRQDSDIVEVKEYVDFKVNKIKLYNDTADFMSEISNTMSQIKNILTKIQLITVTVNGVPTGINNGSDFATISTEIDTIKNKFDSFKV